MPQELDPSVQHARQQLLQQIVGEVTQEHSGDDVEVVLAALRRRLEEAQFPPQPEKWERDTASEITEGRHVVVDRRLGVDVEPGSGHVPEEAGR